jgi:hypothetical protein
MLSHVRIRVLLTLPCLLIGLGSDVVAQAGRLGGTVAYSAPGARSVVARNVRVRASGAYGGAETRTDNNGNFVLVLAAGSYRVTAYGASGYTQYQQVTGYVRAYTDSIITPNPLFLVRASYRSSDSLTHPVLTHRDAWNGHAIVAFQSSLTFEIAAEESGMGWLFGTVKIGDKKKGCQGNSRSAQNFKVTLQGGYDDDELKTNSKGQFVTKALPRGTYTITVTSKGFRDQPAQGTVTPSKANPVSPDPICMIPQ